MSTLSTANIESKAANTPPVIKDLNGAECGQFVRAWLDYDHTTNTIRDSFNIAAVSDEATGRIGITLATAMPSDSYAVTTNASYTNSGIGDGTSIFTNLTNFDKTTTQFGVYNRSYAGTYYDMRRISVIVVGD